MAQRLRGQGESWHRAGAHQTKRNDTDELDPPQPEQVVDRHVDQHHISTCRESIGAAQIFSITLQ